MQSFEITDSGFRIQYRRNCSISARAQNADSWQYNMYEIIQYVYTYIWIGIRFKHILPLTFPSICKPLFSSSLYRFDERLLGKGIYLLYIYLKSINLLIYLSVYHTSFCSASIWYIYTYIYLSRGLIYDVYNSKPWFEAR